MQRQADESDRYRTRPRTAPDEHTSGLSAPSEAPDATDPIGPRRPRSDPASYPFLQPPVEPDELGRLGPYRVLRLLGKGGMGFVFLAEDIGLCRRVALKVMKPDLDGDLDGWKRFLREARIMAALKHEHLVPVYQVGQEGGVIYLAMELLEGESLESWAARVGRAEPLDLVRLGRQIAAGLEALHRRGLVHRDLKPANLWLEEPGRHIRILDLGLARFVHEADGSTQPGMIVGTPAFMAPEQASGRRVEARSDLFCLGAVLYRLATGRLPFDGDSTLELLAALAACKPRPVKELNPKVPRSLAALIARLLAKDPGQRPSSAREVAALLEKIEARLLAAPADGDTVPEKPVRSNQSKKGRTVARRPTPSQCPSAGRRHILIALAVLLVVTLGTALAGGMVYAITSHGSAVRREPVYLSDLLPSDSVNYRTTVLRPPGEPGPPGPDTAVVVRGQRSAHGLFTHPPGLPEGGIVKLSYRLDGKYTTFRGQVALNDGPGRSQTPLTFAIYGDGHLLWRSNAVSTQLDTQSFQVSVKEVQVLTIQTDCPGDPHGAHAVWLDPVVAND